MLIMSCMDDVNIGLQRMIEISFRVKQRFRHAKPFNPDKRHVWLTH